MAPLITPRRFVMAPLMRGPATFHNTVNRNANVTASQNSWLGKVVVSNGGKPPSFLGASVVAWVTGSATMSAEQDDQRDDQAKQAGRFAQRETQQQVGGLGRGGARIAQRARQIAAEHIADADAGPDQCDTGDARANHFCSCKFHWYSLRWFSAKKLVRVVEVK